MHICILASITTSFSLFLILNCAIAKNNLDTEFSHMRCKILMNNKIKCRSILSFVNIRKPEPKIKIVEVNS
jgi:hypothetical protein